LARLAFHDSWFSAQPQTSSSTTPALFSETVADQISSFENNGFTLIKCSAVQNLGDLKTVEAAILKLTAEKRNTGFFYRILRALNLSGEYTVRAPEKRFSIPLHLGLTDSLKKVLDATVSSIRPLLNSQLSSKAALVDLASIISFPSSERQMTHSDVPFRAHKMV
jgi:hypothetical protein